MCVSRKWQFATKGDNIVLRREYKNSNKTKQEVLLVYVPDTAYMCTWDICKTVSHLHKHRCTYMKVSFFDCLSGLANTQSSLQNLKMKAKTQIKINNEI